MPATRGLLALVPADESPLLIRPEPDLRVLAFTPLPEAGAAGRYRVFQFIEPLRAHGIVLDYSPASLKLVKQQADAQGIPVMFVQADATRMPFRDGAIDVSFHQGLLEHFRDPRNVGTLEGPNVAVGRVGNPVCGDMMDIYIEVVDDRIKDIKFQPQ